jgi:hypothetical protein
VTNPDPTRNTVTKRRVTVGETVELLLPWSEVCMHMEVADQVRSVLVTDTGAQLLNEDGTEGSFPITHGEAGLYRDAEGLYALPLPAQLWHVERDGERVSPRMGDTGACERWMQRRTGRPVDYLIQHRGYAIVPALTTPLGVLLTREQLAAWAGRPLTDDDVNRLTNAIPYSSIPETISTIIGSSDAEAGR